MGSIFSSIKLPLHFDAALLMQDLQKLMEQEWILHFQKKHYTGNWKALLLRSPNGDTDNPFLIEDSPEKYQDTVFFKTAPFPAAGTTIF
jgi:hypothetical protein